MPAMDSIASVIERYTADNSGFEYSRNYVSLSNAVMNEENLLNQYLNGFSADHLALLKCYKGLQMERDLLRRLKEVFGDRIILGSEISVFGGKAKGHPDFLYDSYPGDGKSVPLDEHIPVQGRLPMKVYWQLQAYMKYMSKDHAVAIYESRETGSIRDFWITANPRIQNELHIKYSNVVNKINGHS